MNELCQRSIKLTPPGSFTWYTTVWLIILSPLPDFSGNQGNHQNFIPSLARSTLNTLVIFYWNFFIRNSSKKWPTYSGYSLPSLATPLHKVKECYQIGKFAFQWSSGLGCYIKNIIFSCNKKKSQVKSSCFILSQNFNFLFPFMISIFKSKGWPQFDISCLMILY